MKYALLFLIVVACAPKEYDIEPELQPIVDRFFAEGRDRLVLLNRANLQVKWADLPANLGGDAGKDGLNRQRVVRINRLYKGTRIIEHIIFHELGHALLFRKHVSYASIMNPQLKEPMMSKLNIDELFGVSYHPL